jgi:hypothetical protein
MNMSCFSIVLPLPCHYPVLNPEAAAFSPLFVPFGSTGEELPDRLLFSPHRPRVGH